MEPVDDADDAEHRFLRLVCLTYTEPHDAGALEMLRDDPSLATASAYTPAGWAEHAGHSALAEDLTP